jgi:hypothetical protein
MVIGIGRQVDLAGISADKVNGCIIIVGLGSGNIDQGL